MQFAQPQAAGLTPLTAEERVEAQQAVATVQEQLQGLQAASTDPANQSPEAQQAIQGQAAALNQEVFRIQQRLAIPEVTTPDVVPDTGAFEETTTPVDIGATAQDILEFERQKFEAGEPFRRAALEGVEGLRREAAAPIGTSPQFQQALQRGVTGVQQALAPFGLGESTTAAEATSQVATNLLTQEQARKAGLQAQLSGLGQLAPRAEFGVGAGLAGQAGQLGLGARELALREQLGLGGLDISRQQLGLQSQQQLQDFLLGQQRLALQERLGIGVLELQQFLGLEGLKLEREAFRSDEEFRQYQQVIDVFGAGGTIAAGA
jgi:hypothetical protein